MAKFNANEFNRKLREAQRRAEQQFKREVDRVNRANKKAVDDYNRKAAAHNKKVAADFNARVKDHNRRADAHNKKVILQEIQSVRQTRIIEVFKIRLR